MFDVAAHEVMLRFAILLLPALVLILLFTLLYYRRLAEAQDRRDDGRRRAAPMPSCAGRRRVRRYRRRQRHWRRRKPQSKGPPRVRSMPKASFRSSKNSRSAEAKGEPLAALYLALGRAKMASGAEAAALVALRSAAGFAAQQGPPRVHAEARIELAEAAVRAGDPTSACEHWQMARMAFLDAGEKADGEKVECACAPTAARRTGCLRTFEFERRGDAVERGRSFAGRRSAVFGQDLDVDHVAVFHRELFLKRRPPDLATI